MIRICFVSDENLEKRAAAARRFKGRNLIRAALYEELLDRRRAATLDAVAHSMAYEFATSLIDSMCLSQLDEAESPEPFLDLDSSGERGYIDEVEYLEALGLLIHHPLHPRWVQFCNESEATVATPTQDSPKGEQHA